MEFFFFPKSCLNVGGAAYTRVFTVLYQLYLGTLKILTGLQLGEGRLFKNMSERFCLVSRHSALIVLKKWCMIQFQGPLTSELVGLHDHVVCICKDALQQVHVPFILTILCVLSTVEESTRYM